MQSVDCRTAMLTRKDNKLTRTHCLEKIARRWDGGIRRELRRMAQFLWPDARLLGLVPIHSYRLRKQLELEMIVWWVERDIPPFDRYRCEAYRVELSLADPEQPTLVVRSGISAYPVIPMSVEGLKTTLVRASADTPLVIRREFDPALVP
jgi:hypothetical protein